jgi:uncharacterized damage-inducible protein DinB
MTWTAPNITRMDEPTSGGEREQLEAWLDYHRQTLLLKCAGLTADRLRERAVPPSTLSLLGLVRHLAEVERGWFRVRFAGESLAYYWITDDNQDAEFDDVDTADPQEAFDAFDREVKGARAAAAGRSLDDTFLHRGTTFTLRWVYLHMIEEYARHNGHADLLRERIDGATGD